MRTRLRLHPAGLGRYRAWCALPGTDPADVPLVQEVLTAITLDGWPPPAIRADRTVPRWTCFPDPSNQAQWIVALEHLWIVIDPPEADEAVFDLVTIYYPTEDDKSGQPWFSD